MTGPKTIYMGVGPNRSRPAPTDIALTPFRTRVPLQELPPVVLKFRRPGGHVLTVTISASGQASLAWTLDTGNVAALVQWRKTGTPGWSQFLPPNSNQLTLTGLDPTVAYDVQVVQIPTGKLITAASFKPAVAKVVIGINNALGWGAAQSAPAVKAAHLWVRANYDYDSEKPGSLLAAGLTPGVALIGNTDDNTPLANVPLATWLSTTIAQADDAVSHCGISIPLEVGNEMYLKSPRADPVSYAKMFDALVKARPTYRFLFSMTGDYARADGSWSQMYSGHGWLGDAIAAVPALKTEIAGFVSHPYGRMKPVPENSGNTDGPGALPVQHDFAVKLGCANAEQWYLTEYGSTYPTAADGDLQYVDCQVAYRYFMGLPYVRGIYWFAFRGYDGMNPPDSGAFNDDFTPRPVVGTLKALAIGQGQ